MPGTKAAHSPTWQLSHLVKTHKSWPIKRVVARGSTSSAITPSHSSNNALLHFQLEFVSWFSSLALSLFCYIVWPMSLNIGSRSSAVFWAHIFEMFSERESAHSCSAYPRLLLMHRSQKLWPYFIVELKNSRQKSLSLKSKSIKLEIQSNEKCQSCQIVIVNGDSQQFQGTHNLLKS